VRLAAIATAAGAFSAAFGVGGGLLFVPALVVFAHQSPLEATATSLVAIVAMALAGAWRQRGYGNLRVRDVERVLELAFAGVSLAFAWRLAGNAGLR
jgi:uncharacterized membrane protein YfcA